MIPLLLALALLQAPQDPGADPRARDAALGLPGVGKAAPESKPAPQAPPRTFAADRTPRSADDYKALLDHNVFSPPRKKDAPKGEGPKVPDAPKVKTYTLTGIVYLEAEKRYEALFEDRGAKEADYRKVGDSFAGGTISEITFEQVTVTKGAAPTVLKVNDTITVEGVAAGPAAKPEESSEIEKAKERLKSRHKRQDVPDEAEDEVEPRKKPKQ